MSKQIALSSYKNRELWKLALSHPFKHLVLDFLFRQDSAHRAILGAKSEEGEVQKNFLYQKFFESDPWSQFFPYKYLAHILRGKAAPTREIIDKIVENEGYLAHALSIIREDP